MSKPTTGEWTEEWLRRTVASHWDEHKPDYEIICRLHNAVQLQLREQLGAEREAHLDAEGRIAQLSDQYRQLREQLSAERERYKLALSDSQRRGELLDSSQKQLAVAVDALKEARKVTDDPRLGTVNYMEGSHIYTDMNNATKVIDAALAKIGGAK